MRQTVAITLIIGTLFALWLVNTGRWARFANAFKAAYDETGTGGTEGFGIERVTPNAPFPVFPGSPNVRPGTAPLPGLPGIGTPIGSNPSGTAAGAVYAAAYGNPYAALANPGEVVAGIFKYPGQTAKDIINPIIGWTGIRL